MSEVIAPSEVLTIKAPQAEVLQVAYASFKEKGFNISGYDVILLESELVWIVSYQPFDYPAGQRGSIEKKGFTVEVDKATYEVVKTYYAR